MKRISLKGFPLFLIMIGVSALFFFLMPQQFLSAPTSSPWHPSYPNSASSP